MSNIDPSLTRNFKFGVDSAVDAPDVGLDLVTDINLKYEPEVYVKAPDGEGHSISLARSAVKATGTLTGYTTTTAYVAPFSFPFDGLIFIVKKTGKPQPKGQFMEVTLDIEGFAGLPG